VLTYLGFLRWTVRAGMRMGLAAEKQVMGQVAAEMPTHMTSAVAQTFSSPTTEVHRFPVTLPVAEIVAGLNSVQPTMLSGYPSMLGALAHEAREGRLQIAPKLVTATSEPLMPEVRTALREAWGVPVMNWWGTSEGGPNGVSCGFADGMHLAEDMQIIELVDDDYRPVRAGQTATRILQTNLINPLMPLIRYEITDEVRLLTEPCPCGSSFARVDDIQGRTDDCFTYDGGIVVHPHVFRSPLARDAGVLEYQVRQTRDGADVRIVCTDEADLEVLRTALSHHLQDVGVRGAEVTVQRVPQIERTAAGKLARFVPLR
jgi:phenylacetate-coenzyme A ligase PaaK-like adenylate-forming protein